MLIFVQVLSSSMVHITVWLFRLMFWLVVVVGGGGGGGVVEESVLLCTKKLTLMCVKRTIPYLHIQPSS